MSIPLSVWAEKHNNFQIITTPDKHGKKNQSHILCSFSALAPPWSMLQSLRPSVNQHWSWGRKIGRGLISYFSYLFSFCQNILSGGVGTGKVRSRNSFMERNQCPQLKFLLQTPPNCYLICDCSSNFHHYEFFLVLSYLSPPPEKLGLGLLGLP